MQYIEGHPLDRVVRHLRLVRYTASGDLDSTFGAGGIVVTDLSGTDNESAGPIALQADGKIVVAGSAVNPATGAQQFAVFRYHGGDAPAPAAATTALDPAALAALSLDWLSPSGKKSKAVSASADTQLRALDLVFAGI